MPKETFKSLPKPKQELILDAAVNEFASYPYEKASISRIVEQAKIAKGSMYQYFTNKRHLYLYIVKIAYNYKHQYLKDVFDDSDFFTTLKRYYTKSYLFALEYPLYHRVITFYWDDWNPSFVKEVAESKEMRKVDFVRLLQDAMDNNEANPAHSTEAAFFVYHSVGKELIDRFLDIPIGETPQHLQFIESVLDILQSGLGRE